MRVTYYRGWRIVRYKGTQIWGDGRRRKFQGWQLSYPDSDGSKIVDTLDEAYAYIDAYLS